METTALLQSSTLSSYWALNIPRSRLSQGLFTGLLSLLSRELFPRYPCGWLLPSVRPLIGCYLINEDFPHHPM